MNQPEEHRSVNKIMLPFKGKAPMKQNIRVKSHPQGVNLWDQAAWYPVQLWCFEGSSVGKGWPTRAPGLGDKTVMMMEKNQTTAGEKNKQ